MILEFKEDKKFTNFVLKREPLTQKDIGQLVRHWAIGIACLPNANKE